MSDVANESEALGKFHSLADKRSWALHEAVAGLLPTHPELIERARARVRDWQRAPRRYPYAAAWAELLDGPLDALCAALVRTDSAMVTLRQASPFAGALDSRTRWQILKRLDLRSREAG